MATLRCGSGSEPGVRMTSQQNPTDLDQLPRRFRAVPYVGERHPGAIGVAGVEGGANCQQYAYELSRHDGLDPPELRSSDLLADSSWSRDVAEPAPLDLLLFNATADPYGAHVAVHLGSSRAVHLCREMGRPVVWPLEEFHRRHRYRVLVGIKRVTREGTG